MILIDGDACNVISITEKLAKSKDIPCHIYCDTHRVLESDYSEIHVVDCGKDSADFAIINKCGTNDVVITNDSGLAAMVLAKNGFAINTKGFEYTKLNIMSYLTQRHMRTYESRKTKRNQIRGLRTSDPHKKCNYKSTLQNVLNRTERTEIFERQQAMS